MVNLVLEEEYLDYEDEDLYDDYPDEYYEEGYDEDGTTTEEAPGAAAFIQQQNHVASADKKYSSPKPEEHDFPPLKGTDIVSRILDKTETGKALVIFDPDIDGAIAGLFFCWELHKRGIAFKTYVNPGREHGFLLGEKEAKTLAGGTVFAGDFTVTREQVKMLTSNNVSIVCIDHHEFEAGAKDTAFIHYADGEPVTGGTPPEGYTAEGVVVNTQYEWEPEGNRFQSGAGAVWEVLRRITPSMYDISDAKALVGWTLLSDIRDISAPAAKIFLWELFNQPYDGWLKKYADILPRNPFEPFGVPRASRQWVDYSLSPKINSLFRFGLEREAVAFTLGGLYPYADAQKDQRKLVDLLQEIAHVKDYGALTVVAIPRFHPKIPSDVRKHISNFVGLVASNHTEKGKGCLGFVYDGFGNELEDGTPYHQLDGVGRASFRSNITGYPYRENFRGQGVDARGHSMAFGIKNLKPSDDLFENLNSICVEAKTKYPNILKVKVLKTLDWDTLRDIAEHNDYSLTKDQILVKYNPWANTEEEVLIPADDASKFHAEHNILHRYDDGESSSKMPWVTEDQSEKFIKYRVEGIQVLSYGDKHSPVDRFLQVFTVKNTLGVTCKDF